MENRRKNRICFPDSPPLLSPWFGQNFHAFFYRDASCPLRGFAQASVGSWTSATGISPFKRLGFIMSGKRPYGALLRQQRSPGWRMEKE